MPTRQAATRPARRASPTKRPAAARAARPRIDEYLAAVPDDRPLPAALLTTLVKARIARLEKASPKRSA